jgi:hypothetical protein
VDLVAQSLLTVLLGLPTAFTPGLVSVEFQ